MLHFSKLLLVVGVNKCIKFTPGIQNPLINIICVLYLVYKKINTMWHSY